MGGVDIADQLRESFETHKATLRNWWPLFYWLIDVTVINSYRLYRVHMNQLGQKPTLSHLEFRTSLYGFLFSYSQSAQIHRLQQELGGKRLFGSGFEHIHQKVKRIELNQCEWCRYLIKYQKVIGQTAGQRANRSWYGCSFCGVALCQNTDCWS
jgi:hypothetical protein